MYKFIQEYQIQAVFMIVFVVAAALILAGIHITLVDLRGPAYDTCLQLGDYIDIGVWGCIQYANANDSSTVRDYIDYLNNAKSAIPESLLNTRLV